MDEDIYKAVQDAIDAQENMENTNSDDINEVEAPSQPCSTIHQFLQAAQVMNRFLDESNKPKAHQLETILASFCRDLCIDQARVLF